MLGKPYLAAGLAGVLVALSVTAAQACQGSKVLFEDKFTSLGSSWGQDDQASAADGKLSLKSIDQGWTSHLLNQSNAYGDASYCATVNFPVVKDLNSAAAGMIFWGTDDDHYWALIVSPEGSFAVEHKVAASRMLQPVRWTANPVVKAGAGQKYDLEIQTKGNQATVFVNGTKLTEVTGEPPDGGSLTGVYWSLPAESTALTEVTNFKVMK
jgi:hypothetical protein